MSKTKSTALILGVLTMSFLVGYLVLAWTEPTEVPPGGNVPAPLNTSINAQSKEGALVIGTNSAVTTGLIVQYGKVGIGTVSPSQKLNVDPQGVGGILIGNPNTGSGGYTSLLLSISAASGGYSRLQSVKSSGSTWGDISLNPNGGNVGIGTTSPTAKLEVAGQIKITGGTPGAGKVLTSDGTGLASWTPVGGGPIKAWVVFDGDTAPYNIRDSSGVSSVAYQGGGIYRVNWTTPFADTNYAFFVTTSTGPIRLTEIKPEFLRFQLFSISSNPAVTVADYISVVAIDN